MSRPSLATRARGVATNLRIVTTHHAGIRRQRVIDRFGGGALILCYHRVAELDQDPQLLAATPKHFEEQLARLRERFTVRPLRELAEHRGPRRAVALTFDDGYRDNLTAARPALEDAGVPAAVFVTTGYTGAAREFWWDELERLLLVRRPEGTLTLRDRSWELTDETTRRAAYDAIHPWIRTWPTAQIDDVLAQIRRFAGEPEGGEPRPSHAQLTEDEVRELDESPMVEIGAHTVTHPSLAAQMEVAQRDEIVESGRRLEQWLGRRVGIFSYPFGGPTDHSRLTRKLVKQAGYDFAVANFPGQVGRLSSRWQLPRILVRDWNGDELEDVLERALRTG
jgi:peptidoglycan/xylan/chitin deacetylase (PgdA/CDA1 family)